MIPNRKVFQIHRPECVVTEESLYWLYNTNEMRLYRMDKFEIQNSKKIQNFGKWNGNVYYPFDFPSSLFPANEFEWGF